MFQKYKGDLSAELIDEFSEKIALILTELEYDNKDIIRLRMSIENEMCVWLDKLGKGLPCTLIARKWFGRLSILVSCEGPKCDPREQEEGEFVKILDSSFLQSLGIVNGYKYEKGINVISFNPASSDFFSQLFPVISAMIISICLSLVLKISFPSTALLIEAKIISPIFSALLNLLKTIAGPLIFLAVLTGIYGIGDVVTLGVIGKELIKKFILMTFVALAISLVFLLMFVPVQQGNIASWEGVLNSILEMILQFIPSDIISPFLNGNMLQIIFLAISCGIGMLILGDNVSSLAKILEQIYSVVQLLMEYIGKLIPIFVFISVMDFIITNNSNDIFKYLLPIFVVFVTFIILALIIYPILIYKNLKINIALLFKKLLPTYLVAFTTASSTAAFSTNLETCEERLGISEKITKFGIPIGQVIYMPLGAAESIAIVMTLAPLYGVTVTPTWLFMAIFISGVLAIATPPIPGGALSIFTVLFMQLNIPIEALSIAISIDLIMDYFITAGNIACLQEELILCANKMNFIDKEILKKP